MKIAFNFLDARFILIRNFGVTTAASPSQTAPTEVLDVARPRSTVVTRFLASDGRRARHFFNVVFPAAGPAVFRYFSTPSTPSPFPFPGSSTSTKMKWRSIPENRVIPEIRCSQHFRHAEPFGGGKRRRGKGSWGGRNGGRGTKPRKFAAGN